MQIWPHKKINLTPKSLYTSKQCHPMLWQFVLIYLRHPEYELQLYASCIYVT